MLEHRIPNFRSLDRSNTDCDLKWRCVDVTEAKNMQISDVPNFEI